MYEVGVPPPPAPVLIVTDTSEPLPAKLAFPWASVIMTPEIWSADVLVGSLFDTVYVHTVHRLAHVSLPEVTLTEDFDPISMWAWVDRIASARLRTIVTGRLTQILVSAQPWDGP